ncbi:DinB family protein [Paludibaculum fermentans]|uniref:DinB family protein n=1 Tax=Paludibaculum fermentans TaxID=1473598 RepID=A0A7S7NP15_PALFE|nr:DinB family protein [Paludibaculum fermentans]QOY87152.1 DinB family protein [Paludibaculum fermentans]
MSRYLLSLLTLLATPLVAQSLAQGERDYALSALHASRKLMLDTVSGLSDAQLKWKPAPNAWSIMEIAEHIEVTEEKLPQVVVAALKNPATPEKKKADPRQTDYALMKNVPLRDQKLQAPESIQPNGRFTNIADIEKAFRTARDRNITYVRETKDDLRDHFSTHPALGELDGLQWYILIAAHTERHVNQMKEVLANPAFPKK